MKKVIVAVLGIVAVFAVKFATSEGVQAGAGYVEKEIALSNIEEAMQTNAEIGGYFQALETHFPDEYESMLAEIKATVRTADAGDDVGTQMVTYSRELMAPMRGMAIRAPDAELERHFLSIRDAMRHLKSHDPEACGTFVMTGADMTMQSVPGFNDKVNASGVAMIEAAAAARDNPVARGEPTDDEYAMFGQRIMENGINPEHLMLLENNQLHQLSGAEQCDLVLTMYDVVTGMPSPMRPRFMALLLS